MKIERQPKKYNLQITTESIVEAVMTKVELNL